MEKSGLWLAFLLALAVLGVGWDTIRSGHATAGTAIITGVLVGLVGVFVYGSKHRPSGAVIEKENESPREPPD